MLGKEDKVWTQNLPNIISELQVQWELSDLSPVNNMTFNYVMKGFQRNDPVVLKISHSETAFKDEKSALQAFAGHGCVQLLDYDSIHHALLVEQANPGTSLKALYCRNKGFAIDAYISVAQALQSPLNFPKKARFPHVRDWLKSIEMADSQKIPQEDLDRALHLKKKLLKSSVREHLLHGDLHHDNILQSQDSFLAIDPKGVIGELAFELAAFDFIHSSELSSSENIPTLFQKRLQKIAEKSGLNPDRIADWVFVRLILGAAWSLEDKQDPGLFLELLQKIFKNG